MSTAEDVGRKEVAQFIEKCINASKLDQKEIADICGFKNPNVITMIKQGHTKLPIVKIPYLARALDLDRVEFFIFVMERYRPDELEVIRNVLGDPITEAERKMIKVIREVIPEGQLIANPDHFSDKIRVALS